MAEADLFALYQVDAREWLGHRPNISLLVGLIERLALEPFSRHRASIMGGDEWFGYSIDSARLSDVFDATVFGAQASARQEVKYKQIAPRPGDHTKAHVALGAVEDFDQLPMTLSLPF